MTTPRTPSDLRDATALQCEAAFIAGQVAYATMREIDRHVLILNDTARARILEALRPVLQAEISELLREKAAVRC